MFRNIYKAIREELRKIVTFRFVAVDIYSIGKLRANYHQNLIFEVVK